MDCFDKLPEWAKSRLSVTPGHREWKKCAMCGVYNTSASLKICSGCVKGRAEPIYYCSKECQKRHWRNHKEDCKKHSTPEAEGRLTHEPDFPQDAKVEKLIKRWITIYPHFITWCIGQLYHYNPHLDPQKSIAFIQLHPETFQIRWLGVECRSKHAYFFEQESIKAWDPKVQFCLIIVPAWKGNVGCTVSHPGYYPRIETLERRRTIPGCPQWPWIAAHITSTWQPNPFVAVKKSGILAAAVEGHLLRGTLNLDPIFRTPPAFRLNEPFNISSELMSRWYAHLSSVDLWAPLLYPNNLQVLLDHDHFDPEKNRSPLMMKL